MNYSIKTLAHFIDGHLPDVALCLVSDCKGFSDMCDSARLDLLSDRIGTLSILNPRVFGFILDAFMLCEHCKKPDAKLF